MICLIRKNNFLYVLFLFLFHQSSAQSLSFMDTLHKKCERKWSNIGEPSIGTKFVAIGIPPMHIISNIYIVYARVIYDIGYGIGNFFEIAPPFFKNRKFQMKNK